jgi:hypothetical protein
LTDRRSGSSEVKEFERAAAVLQYAYVTLFGPYTL